ncbi:MAG: 4-(cytidine 5'-diphospho)-2-C-methyl-D-erythritol kinase [Betaproteobacteria bacterium]|nr:4-(cytidine 5'-diphospho)-2-C-methyl-D-erythritol kinase [Betaproteobacteria bacterium]
MGNSISCPAPAKLNLFLHVVGRRADGYHLLQTLFRFIDFGDTLHFTLREDGAVRRISALDGVPQEQDLCARAARLLQQECGCPLGVDIALEKRIPLGGGLGGGSSDAATTLLALNRLWQLGLSRERLMRLGLSLGADVPVFVFGENAFAEGVGERLQAYTMPDTWYVVLFPPVHVATAQIFAHPELTRDTISLRIRDLSLRALHNDLQPVVCSLYPEVARHLSWLGRFAEARMTGSGACVFAEFASAGQAQAVLEQLPPDMRGIVARGLPHHPLRDFATP